MTHAWPRQTSCWVRAVMMLDKPNLYLLVKQGGYKKSKLSGTFYKSTKHGVYFVNPKYKTINAKSHSPCGCFSDLIRNESKCTEPILCLRYHLKDYKEEIKLIRSCGFWNYEDKLEYFKDDIRTSDSTCPICYCPFHGGGITHHTSYYP